MRARSARKGCEAPSRGFVAERAVRSRERPRHHVKQPIPKRQWALLRKLARFYTDVFEGSFAVWEVAVR